MTTRILAVSAEENNNVGILKMDLDNVVDITDLIDVLIPLILQWEKDNKVYSVAVMTMFGKMIEEGKKVLEIK